MPTENDERRANSLAQLPRRASRNTDEVAERWNTEKFSDVADLKYGKALSAARRRGGAVPVCGSNGVVGYHDESLISGPGIVIGRKGAAGAVTYIDSDFWPIDTTYYVDCKQHSDLKWLYYAISCLRFENFRGGPVPGLNRQSVAELAVEVPPLREQRKIAAILSSIDDVIKKYQAVVNEVQVVKHGLMQQMLVRKNQVPHGAEVPSCSNASEHWDTVNLGDIATIVGGGTPKTGQSDYWNGNIPWATPTDITQLSGRTISRTASTITDSGLENSTATLLPPKSLLVTTRATIGACAINTTPMATNQGFQSLVPKDGVCVEFLYYLVQRHAKGLRRLGTGSTYLEVSRRAVSEFSICLPPLLEQRRISAILSSLDDTMYVLSTIIDRYRDVKLALMPLLLTGKVRVSPGTEAAVPSWLPAGVA